MIFWLQSVQLVDHNAIREYVKTNFTKDINICGGGCGCSIEPSTTCLQDPKCGFHIYSSQPLNCENILVCDWPGECRLPALLAGAFNKTKLLLRRYSLGLRSFPATLRLPAKRMIHFWMLGKIPPDKCLSGICLKFVKTHTTKIQDSSKKVFYQEYLR